MWNEGNTDVGGQTRGWWKEGRDVEGREDCGMRGEYKCGRWKKRKDALVKSETEEVVEWFDRLKASDRGVWVRDKECGEMDRGPIIT